MNRSFTLPDLGEGIAEAEIVSWHVDVGDAVVEDQPLVDVETAKAIVTVPSPYSGTVVDRGGSEGTQISVGAPLVVIDAAPDGTSPDPAPDPAPDAAPDPTPDPAPGEGSTPPAATPSAPRGRRVLAAPSVRRRARERGIDLAAVAGSGPAGRVTRADLDRHQPGEVSPSPTCAPGDRGPGAGRPAATSPGETRSPMRGLRRATSRVVQAGWRTIPHIVDLRQADASALLAARDALGTDIERRGGGSGGGIVLLALLVKITQLALLRHPEMHGYVDEDHEEIVRHGACRPGIAVSTPDGLLTPVLSDPGNRSIPDLADELRSLVSDARSRRLTQAQLTGATYLVNNLGALGTWHAMPLIPVGLGGNAGFGRITEQPVVRGGALAVGRVLPLSVSADHRLVDGAELASFAATLVRLVETPALLLGGAV